MEQNTLAHYGILGMKWGVRRTPEELARARGKTPSETSEDTKESSKKTSSSTKKKVSEMSDDELRRVVQRLQLEKQYRDLTPKQVSTGQKIVNKILKDIVIPSATEVGKQVVKTEFEKLAKKTKKTKKTQK